MRLPIQSLPGILDPASHSRAPQNMNLASVFVPPEICDRTIDFLWNDPAALMSCSLTCTLWLPRSRYHLFRARPVKLYNPSGYKRLEAILRRSTEASTGLAHYIHHLDIYAGNPSLVGSDITWLKLVDPATPLSRLFASLTSVRRLTLWGCCRVRDGSWKHVPADVYDPLFRFISQPAFASTLTTLCLGATTFASIHDFLRLLSAFPRLSCLDLRRCHIEHGPPPSPDTPPARHPAGNAPLPLPLHGELRVSVPPSDPWQPLDLPLWLTSDVFALHSDTLRWDGCATVQGHPLLHDVLQRLAPTLTHLHINLWLDEDEAPVRSALAALATCRALVFAHIRCHTRAGALAAL
ncbi:hypothetical protein B0H21DRAFT_786449, partial [Amylocystis lapponica]